MINKKNKTIGITMGDPAGIGPEIILKSFEKNIIRKNQIIVIGDYDIMQAVQKMLGISSFRLHGTDDLSKCYFNPGVLNVLDLHLLAPDEFSPGKIQSITGRAAFRYVSKAVELAMNKDIDSIVTAPLNKAALHLAGYEYPGHTEILATLSGAKDYAMLLVGKKLKVIHASTHESLLDAITHMSRSRIEKIIEMANDTMLRLSETKPRIAVAGINPHAGEDGLFGDEELKILIPAIKQMRARGVNVEGPFPPDTVFMQALKGKYDIVVAMYHDQGHIPLKLIEFESGVNMTAGLPFIRTSVDHGTAFDIAWKGIASEKSMVEAIKLAVKLTLEGPESWHR
jgi:4-hydroxythreonine-4-phosphate dehydrogenase